MSLINDVLKNLERRQASQPARNTEALASLQQTRHADGVPERLSYVRVFFFIVLAAIVVGVLAFAGYYGYQLLHHKKMAVQGLQQHISQKIAGHIIGVSPANTVTGAQNPAAVGGSASMGSQANANTTLAPSSDSRDKSTKDDKTKLSSDAAKDSMKDLSKDATKDLTDAVKMVELANPELQPKANAALPPPPDLQGNSASNDKAPSTVAAGANAKTINVPLNSLKQATAATTGVSADADPLNFSLVESHLPGEQLKMQLIRIDELGQMGKAEQANLLFEQLPAHADPQEKVILAAKLLTYRNKNNQAIQLLEHYAKNNKPSADCLGLLAALYDMTGRYQLAQMGYQKLVDFWPGNSRWWLGLAVAAMHNEQYSLAISSFERVQSFQDELSPEINDFVHIKLRMLTTDHPTYY